MKRMIPDPTTVAVPRAPVSSRGWTNNGASLMKHPRRTYTAFVKRITCHHPPQTLNYPQGVHRHSQTLENVGVSRKHCTSSCNRSCFLHACSLEQHIEFQLPSLYAGDSPEPCRPRRHPSSLPFGSPTPRHDIAMTAGHMSWELWHRGQPSKSGGA